MDRYSGTARAYGYLEVRTMVDQLATAVDRSRQDDGATTDTVSAQARYVRVQVLGASTRARGRPAERDHGHGIPASTPVPTPAPTATPTPEHQRRHRGRPLRPTHAGPHADARSDSGPHTDTPIRLHPPDADVDSYRDADSYVHSHADTTPTPTSTPTPTPTPTHRLRRLPNSPCSAT